jgi:hypothetical protein
MNITEAAALPFDTALVYIGRRPERDVPTWMKSKMMSRRIDGGMIEVFTADGSRILSLGDVAVVGTPEAADAEHVNRLYGYRVSFAAAGGNTVTQGHTDACAEFGHADWAVDGKLTERCARCGELRDDDAYDERPIATGDVVQYVTTDGEPRTLTGVVTRIYGQPLSHDGRNFRTQPYAIVHVAGMLGTPRHVRVEQLTRAEYALKYTQHGLDCDGCVEQIGRAIVHLMLVGGRVVPALVGGPRGSLHLARVERV